MPALHVIGGGLAGLSAAIAATEAGWRAVVYEAGPHLGGRCRSYDDRELGCRVDNGNHLLLSGNDAAMRYLDTIGARATMGGPGAAFFPFFDAESGARWTLRPSAGRMPFWLFAPDRRVPGTRARDYLRLRRLLRVRGPRHLADVLPSGALRRNLLEPLAISALNTPVAQARASLMAAVMRETLLRGGAACIPLFPRESLGASLIEPALAWLRARGATVHTGARVVSLTTGHAARLTAFTLASGEAVVLGPGDAAVLAVPPWVAADLLPELVVPTAFEAIVNVHYAADGLPLDTVPAPIRRAGFAGLVGASAEWVFLKPGHVSVTISAANRLADVASETLAERIWIDVAACLQLSTAKPRHRVVREKRATFAATPVQDARRPGLGTGLPNLTLAGDWTATGLPATIEGAIRSGRVAAVAAMKPSPADPAPGQRAALGG